MHNHVAVKVRDSLEDLASVFPSDVFRESTVRLQLVLHRPLAKSKHNGSAKKGQATNLAVSIQLLRAVTVLCTQPAEQ